MVCWVFVVGRRSLVVCCFSVLLGGRCVWFVVCLLFVFVVCGSWFVVCCLMFLLVQNRVLFL